jgi:hypothetical protein
MKSLTAVIAALALLGSISFASAESCCDKAKAAGKECDHKCCVKANARRVRAVRAMPRQALQP